MKYELLCHLPFLVQLGNRKWNKIIITNVVLFFQECRVIEKKFSTSQDDDKEDIIKYWLQEINDSVTSVNSIKQLDAAEALAASPPDESVSNNELDAASDTVSSNGYPYVSMLTKLVGVSCFFITVFF